MIEMGDKLPTLEAERVRLRWLMSDDVPALYEIFSDVDVMKYWSCPPFTSVDQAAELLAEIESYFRKRHLFQWGIERKEDGRIVGTCTLGHVDETHRRAELGYALGRSYWGNGYVAEALPAALDFAFGPLDLHRLEADADPRNAASIRALERLGFVREGHQRERYFHMGEIQDAAMFGLLRREWRALRAGEHG